MTWPDSMVARGAPERSTAGAVSAVRTELDVPRRVGAAGVVVALAPGEHRRATAVERQPHVVPVGEEEPVRLRLRLGGVVGRHLLGGPAPRGAPGRGRSEPDVPAVLVIDRCTGPVVHPGHRYGPGGAGNQGGEEGVTARAGASR